MPKPRWVVLLVADLFWPDAAVAQADCERWNTRSFFETADAEAVHARLAKGADPNARTEGGWTPLHDAASADVPDAIAALPDAGADAGLLTADFEFPFDLIEDDSPLKGTDVYWRLSDARWE